MKDPIVKATEQTYAYPSLWIYVLLRHYIPRDLGFKIANDTQTKCGKSNKFHGAWDLDSRGRFFYWALFGRTDYERLI